jgi:WXXGXW repeat (2 copies)
MSGSCSTGRLLVALVFLHGLTSCVVVPNTPPPRGILVSGPPPAVIREERPPQPAPLATWVAGYWHWTGLQYAWIPGHWEAAPPAGATWRAPAYVQNNGAYFYEPGGWAPPGLVPASGGSPAKGPSAATPPSVEAFH